MSDITEQKKKNKQTKIVAQSTSNTKPSSEVNFS